MNKNQNQTKILYIITQSKWGGAQQYVLSLIKNMPPNFTPYLAIGEKREEDDFWIKEAEKHTKSKTLYFKYLKRDLKLPEDILVFFEFIKILKKTDPDIIHLNSSKTGAVGAVSAKIYNIIFRKKVKVVYTVHGFILLEPLNWWRKIYYFIAEKISSYFKDTIIVISQKDKETMKKNKIASDKKLVLIYNSKEPAEYLPKDKARDYLQNIINQNIKDKYIIGTISNLYPVKGIDFLIKSAKAFFDKYPKYRERVVFIVIGEGPARDKLEKDIASYNLKDNFFLAGFLPYAEKYIKAFDIFTLTSYKEGFPYVLLDAGFASLPVIASSVGAIPEIIKQNQSGIILEKHNQEKTADYIFQLISNNELRKKLEQNLYNSIHYFSLKNMIDSTLKAYNEI